MNKPMSDTLTREQIEEIRKGQGGVSYDTWTALCDLALRALEQNAAPQDRVEQKLLLKLDPSALTGTLLSESPAGAAPIKAGDQQSANSPGRDSTAAGPVPAAPSPVLHEHEGKIYRTNPDPRAVLTNPDPTPVSAVEEVEALMRKWSISEGATSTCAPEVREAYDKALDLAWRLEFWKAAAADACEKRTAAEAALREANDPYARQKRLALIDDCQRKDALLQDLEERTSASASRRNSGS